MEESVVHGGLHVSREGDLAHFRGRLCAQLRGPRGCRRRPHHVVVGKLGFPTQPVGRDEPVGILAEISRVRLDGGAVESGVDRRRAAIGDVLGLLTAAREGDPADDGENSENLQGEEVLAHVGRVLSGTSGLGVSRPITSLL